MQSGDGLRDARTRQNRTLRDVSTAANVSLGYLSEVERGRKEASSELLASICDALDLEVADLLDSVSRTMRTERSCPPRRTFIANSAKAGLSAVEPAGVGSLAGSKIDPSLRIVVPYGATRPGRPSADRAAARQVLVCARARRAAQRVVGALDRHEQVVVVIAGDHVAGDPVRRQRARHGRRQADRVERRLHGDPDPGAAEVAVEPGGGRVAGRKHQRESLRLEHGHHRPHTGGRFAGPTVQ